MGSIPIPDGLLCSGHLSGYPTSMISLCQEGKSSPDAPRRSACTNSFDSSSRVLASQPWFLFQIRTRLPFAVSAFPAAQKIEFVFSCQSRNLSTGASRACAPSPSRFNGKTWQATRRGNPPCSPPRSTQRCTYSSPLPENPAAHGRPPRGRPPVSLLPPALRDWHCLSAFPCHRAALRPRCSAAPSSPPG